MMLGSAVLGGVSFASTEQDSGNSTDAQASRPFTLELNGVDVRESFQVDSLQISDTLGQPMSCSFTLVNPSTRPRPGDVVRVLYYSEVLIAGLMTRCEPTPSLDLVATFYACESSDWSVLLTRRRMRRNFTDLPVANIVDSILDNELVGDGLTIGTIDQGASIPIVDVKNGRVFDVLRDVAGATGQSMYVDFNKAIQFVSTSNADSPKPLDYSTVEGSSLTEDLEGYRNVQTVVVTGTPGPSEDAETAVVTRTNDNQIQARIVIEGGTGRYEEIEEATHPTSNDGGDLTLLGIGVARLLLMTRGTPRRTLRCKVRGYGIRAGQFVMVDLPAVNASGTWLIQRATLTEQAAQYIIYDVEATESSAQIRAYESWLNIVKAGKVTIQMPGSITSNLELFDATGADTWVVPAGVTSVEVSCYGGGGGGGGATGYYDFNGGNGGVSGFAITTISVLPGQTLSLFVGSGGSPGSSTSSSGVYSWTSGTDGTHSSVTYNGAIVCQGNGGGAGLRAWDDGTFTNGADGTAGSGIGDAVSVGGGVAGGTRGTDTAAFPDTTVTQPTPGNSGRVEIRW